MEEIGVLADFNFFVSDGCFQFNLKPPTLGLVMQRCIDPKRPTQRAFLTTLFGRGLVLIKLDP